MLINSVISVVFHQPWRNPKNMQELYSTCLIKKESSWAAEQIKISVCSQVTPRRAWVGEESQGTHHLCPRMSAPRSPSPTPRWPWLCCKAPADPAEGGFLQSLLNKICSLWCTCHPSAGTWKTFLPLHSTNYYCSAGKQLHKLHQINPNSNQKKTRTVLYSKFIVINSLHYSRDPTVEYKQLRH